MRMHFSLALLLGLAVVAAGEPLARADDSGQAGGCVTAASPIGDSESLATALSDCAAAGAAPAAPAAPAAGPAACEAQACDPCAAVCCRCCPTEDDSFCHYLPQFCRLHTYGWLNGGFVWNTADPASKFNGPYNGVDRSNEAMFNQGYLVSEFVLPRDGSFGFGGRVDLLYGEDFLLAQSLGWELNDDATRRWNSGEYYGLALPQLYAEAGWQDLSVKIGHFYTIIGYEGVTAPGNFFYSKSYSYQFGGPFTHWGGLVNWNVNDCWQLQAGVHNGWNALDREEDHLGFIGGIKYTDPCDSWWSSFAVITGEEDNDPAGLLPVATYTNRTRYSWLVDLQLTCRLEYVFHHWLGVQEDGAADGSNAWWYGVDQYLYYTLNDCWKAGARFEWFRDEDGTRIGLNGASNPNNPRFIGDAYSVGLGLNWTPTTNLTVRPELRWDWFDGTGLPYDDGTDDSQLMLAADFIWRF